MKARLLSTHGFYGVPEHLVGQVFDVFVEDGFIRIPEYQGSRGHEGQNYYVLRPDEEEELRDGPTHKAVLKSNEGMLHVPDQLVGSVVDVIKSGYCCHIAGALYSHGTLGDHYELVEADQEKKEDEVVYRLREEGTLLPAGVTQKFSLDGRFAVFKLLYDYYRCLGIHLCVEDIIEDADLIIDFIETGDK